MSQSCYTPDCDGYVGDRSHIGLCQKCYAYINYWHKKTPKQLVKRAMDLQTYGQRMNFLMPPKVVIPARKIKTVLLPIMPGEYRTGKKRKIKKAA